MAFDTHLCEPHCRLLLMASRIFPTSSRPCETLTLGVDCRKRAAPPSRSPRKNRRLSVARMQFWRATLRGSRHNGRFATVTAVTV
jgi:hypothetical protein